jgi:hypothetical protein
MRWRRHDVVGQKHTSPGELREFLALVDHAGLDGSRLGLAAALLGRGRLDQFQLGGELLAHLVQLVDAQVLINHLLLLPLDLLGDGGRDGLLIESHELRKAEQGERKAGVRECAKSGAQPTV